MKQPTYFIESYSCIRWYGKFWRNGHLVDYKHFDYWRTKIQPYGIGSDTIAIWKVYPKQSQHINDSQEFRGFM